VQLVGECGVRLERQARKGYACKMGEGRRGQGAPPRDQTDVACMASKQRDLPQRCVNQKLRQNQGGLHTVKERSGGAAAIVTWEGGLMSNAS